MAAEYSLVCTTRFDPFLEAFAWNKAPDGTPSPYLLLAHQLDRLLAAARLSRWSASLDYTTLKNVCDGAVRSAAGKTPLKIRVLFPQSGRIAASACPVDPLHCDPTAASQFNLDVDTLPQFGPILSIRIDTRPTSATIPMKTTYRKPYDDARARVGLPPLGAPHTPNRHPDDVILFNTAGAIMESSICNVAFYRHGTWLTPPLTVGCIPGVFRRWLLENGRIHEAHEQSISSDTVQNNEWVLLFNGVTGCRLGRVCRDT